jgi:DNA-binding response OmpR family regulator
MALVLCVGSDEVLMKTRKLVLERAGHKVVLGMSDPDTRQAAGQYSFDVAVLGQNLQEERKRTTFKFLRANYPNVKILELHIVHTHPVLASADDWLVVPVDVPRELEEHVTALAATR